MRECRSRSTSRTALLGTFVFALGCGGGSANASPCGGGRTTLDGVCVSEGVADYVGCVRAQGARLDSENAKKLSAQVGFAGTQAGAASDVSNKLRKEYATSDENVLAVIKSCDDFKRQAIEHSRDPVNAEAKCECLKWEDVNWTWLKGGNIVCDGGEQCANQYGLVGNRCADPDQLLGKKWCYTSKACPTSIPANRGNRWRYCE